MTLMKITLTSDRIGDLSQAACGDANPDLFFSVDIRDIAEAKAYCRICPLVESCLNEAMANEEIGVWGGTTTEDRIAIKRKRTIMAKAAAAGIDMSANRSKRKIKTSGADRRNHSFLEFNAARAAEAAIRDVKTFSEILNKYGDSLPPGMKELLRLRVDYPNASISELGRLSTPQMSKDKAAGILRRAKLLA